MITFLDERDVEHGALATIKVTNAVNGERSLTGEIESGDYVLANIERGWRLRFDDEFYVVTYAKPIDDGKGTHVTFDAVHQFFWDFDKSSVHEQLNDGSHTFLTYLDFIFTGSDYTYTIDPLLKVYAFEKQSFGYKSRLNLFNDIITASGVEFQVNGKVVRILEKTGTDLSTVVRKNFNMNELGIEKHIGDFVTYQKGFGAWVDENDHTKGRLVTEYTSPLASVYGKLEAEPLVDERYTQADNMIAALKANVDNSYSISVRLDMEDLTRAGYEYTQPRAGDYIMAINETLDFQEKIRIVSFTSEYDVTGQLIKHEVTCNDIGAVKKLSASYNLTKEQAKNASDSVGKAVEMANKALVSADGKSTVYFGNEFPKNEPKGTLHKGDSLYLTVGDTTKMYYWTGADWEELPIVNDVEAFKEQIADELKDVPNREEFEATITEKLATSKAEIKTQIDTAKTQAESNAKAYADEINQATAEVAEQANTAANTLKSDLAKVKTDLTTTTSTANAAKTSASEAKQQLTTVANDLSKAKTDLQNAVSAVDTKTMNLQSDLTKAKQDLTSQASQLTEQANAQSELTKRVSTVEETANGTKSTVSELTKTVAQNGKDITSVTARTKTVEDDLLNTKTTLSQVKTTADSTSQKTATLETGLNGLSAKFSNLRVGGVNLIKQSTAQTGLRLGMDAGPFPDSKHALTDWIKIEPSTVYTLTTYEDVTETNMWYSLAWYSSNVNDYSGWISRPTGAATAADLKGGKQYTSPANATYAKVSYPNNYPKVKLERGNIATDYSPSEADIEQKVADYKQTADQNYASLQTTVQNLDGTVQQNKTVADQTAQGFSTRIESLETYKDGETTRANQYFELAKTETARQLTAERTAIAKDYVAKSTYTSDVTGIRNDLTATTTTANTTKTNLANYQASNDKAVANLQSNLQTANGNISSLQTKVEAVPGQITSAVSAVEGKIPTEIGSSNLLRNTAVNAENLNLFYKSDTDVSVVEKDGYQTYKLVVSGASNSGAYFNGNNGYYNLVKDRDYTFSFWVLTNKDKDYNMNSLGHIQVFNSNSDKVGDDIFHQHTQPVYSTNVIKANTWTKVWCTFKAISNSFFRPFFWDLTAGDEIYIYDMMLNEGKIPLSYTPAVEDTVSQISTLNTTLTQTAEGLTQLSTKVDTQGSTITSHTNSINSLSTGLSAKVSQTDFNTLSGRVTTAENNITAKANELSSKITSVEGKIPTSIGGTNLVRGTANFSSGWTWNTKVATVTDIIDDFNVYHSTSTGANTASNNYDIQFDNALTVLPGTEYTLSFWAKGSGTIYSHFFPSCVAHGVNSDGKTTTEADGYISHTLKSDWERYWVTWKTLPTVSGLKNLIPCRQPADFKSEVWLYGVKLERGSVPTDWSPAPEDYDSKLAAAQSEIKQTTDSITASVSSVQATASNAQATANTAVSKADAAQAGVSTLDSTTVKSASLTINTDGIVMKAGKSTTDVANAIGSYFAVNQNAINLFSDKINVKGSMIVDGAITSTKIASKTIDTAHLNGKIITADVISSNAITADAIKAGAVTTDKMTANSINGDRITAGTLDAAKIKAGSITASQIASGTITSAQIKTGTISAGNIATGAITTDKIAANSINSDKIVSSGITANVINGGKLQSLTNTTNFDLDTGKLFYNNNNTGVFRVEDGASTMGLKFSNTAITVNNTSRILSRVILGGDRRETTLDDGKWDQGGFTGIVAETINGVASNEHGQADTLRVIGDNVYFTHSYNNDVLTNMPAQGWKMENYSPFSSIPGSVILKPYGINYRNSSIIAGDFRLDNGDGSGYWLRATINTLKNCFGHILNGGTSSQALNAIRSELNKISGT
ncbi:Chromosome partition protein Smc [Streptococcus infantarius subsp. infantarius]|nr:Chromosome partition protein Smc [Streptococcus infantarius subsp. infantarius]